MTISKIVNAMPLISSVARIFAKSDEQRDALQTVATSTDELNAAIAGDLNAVARLIARFGGDDAFAAALDEADDAGTDDDDRGVAALIAANTAAAQRNAITLKQHRAALVQLGNTVEVQAGNVAEIRHQTGNAHLEIQGSLSATNENVDELRAAVRELTRRVEWLEKITDAKAARLGAEAGAADAEAERAAAAPTAAPPAAQDVPAEDAPTATPPTDELAAALDGASAAVQRNKQRAGGRVV